MTMKQIARYSIFTVLLLFCFSLLQAQNPSQILADAEKAIFTDKILKASFTSKTSVTSSDVVSVISGTLYMEKEKFRLEYGGITAAYSDGLLSVYNEDENTLTISKPSGEELLQINPLLFLSSRAKGFHVKTEGAFKGGNSLRFTPAKSEMLKYFVVDFITKTKLPHKILIYGRDGSHMEVAVHSLDPYGGKSDSAFFHLSKARYPHAEVVDLR